ncbi:MAG: exodeoxyribonuclease V subunit gamma, partial [Lachnospiraceae bacterium]|nr:exodeoxyribonuclease V subunit gamma [Lachnospiraceae bacterium]
MLRFVLGPSGAGKSTLLRQEIIDRSIAAPTDDFLIIVPDQFTMQTQMDMVKAHPDGAIMNIDILSFSRLTHRIFDTVGQPPFADRILDDTGKSLILRKIALRHAKELPLLGANMRKAGFIDEVKSVISEFMQYGISADGIDALRAVCGSRKILAQKLSELQFLYQKFLEEIKGSYMTTEERLDLLCDALPKSPLVRDAVIVFDGFTGFTPIQYRVIRQLLSLAREVIFTFTTDKDCACEEQDLFYLSYKTMSDLRNIAQEAGVKEAPVSILNSRPVPRLKDAWMLSHLERSLFGRRDAAVQAPEAMKKGTADETQIHIFTAENPQEEVREVFLRIYDLVRKEGCAYRDIAVVAGTLNSYADTIERVAAQFEIPVFIDRTSTLHLNPFTAYLKAALRIMISGFQAEHVLQFLRTGFADMSDEEIDLLETYMRATGVRYRKGFEEAFVRQLDAAHPDAAFLERMNGLRERFLQHIAPLVALKSSKEHAASSFTQALREMILFTNAEEKLFAYAASFAEAGDYVREKEYEHILEKTLALFDQIESISGDEKMTFREFYELLCTGMGEFVTGTIPLSVDRVVAGDMERTRLKEVKHLFFLGVDDTAIPKEVSGSGL